MISPLSPFAQPPPLDLRGPATVPPGFNPALDRPAGLTPSPTGPNRVDGFGALVANLVNQVEGVRQNAAAQTQQVMLGQSGALHTSVIALQESSIALSLMVEVRNKLVESYQELLRTPV
jgi:flagellar hook-basal body complex protein FliE